jgi:uncharacterized protein (TIGR02145 family)
MYRYLYVAVLCGLFAVASAQTECEIPGLYAPAFSCGDPISFDDHNYGTVQIGDQCWFQENLRNTHYANGEVIPGDLSTEDWAATDSGAHAYPNNDAGHLNSYGRLYNWHAVVDGRQLCPTDWHVPTHQEWQTIEAALGMPASEVGSWGAWRGAVQNVGGQLKEAGTSHWSSDNDGLNTNASGFSAIPAGLRNASGNFNYIQTRSCFWTSSANPGPYAKYRMMKDVKEGVYLNAVPDGYGLSVRCVQDAQ